MDDERKYLLFKIILRFSATACVVLGWILKDTGQAGASLGGGAVLFWTGIAVTVISFFL